MPFTNWPELKMMLMSAFYVGCNFLPLLLPIFVVSELYWKHWWCRILVAVAIVDYLVPLRPGPKGYSASFSHWSNTLKGLHSYNNAEIVVEAEFDTDKNYLVCYFPHAVYGVGGILIADYVYQKHGTRYLFTGADIIFWIPVLRRIMTWWGCTEVSSQALRKNLQNPHPFNVLQLQPDGIGGMFYGIEQEQILLNRRKGFCRIALQTGASLVPCYTFGANELSRRTFGPNSWAARLSRKFRVSFIYWTDRFGIPLGCVPVPVKLVVAVGAPIEVDKSESPTAEQIDALHAMFIQAIKELYNRHKHKMGKEWALARPRLYLETEKSSGLKTD